MGWRFLCWAWCWRWPADSAPSHHSCAHCRCWLVWAAAWRARMGGDVPTYRCAGQRPHTRFGGGSAAHRAGCLFPLPAGLFGVCAKRQSTAPACQRLYILGLFFVWAVALVAALRYWQPALWQGIYFADVLARDFIAIPGALLAAAALMAQQRALRASCLHVPLWPRPGLGSHGAASVWRCGTLSALQ